MAAAAFERGVVVYPVAGSLSGVRGDFVVVAPAFTVEQEHIEAIASALDAGLTAVETRVKGT